MRDWNPEEVKAALDTELQVEGPDLSYEGVAKRKLREALPLAVDRLVHLALYSTNERTAIAATEYIIERVLGRTTDVPLSGAASDDILAELVRDVVKSAQ